MNIRTKPSYQKFVNPKLLIFLSSFSPLFIYWLAFYPGILTYDSHYVWDQLSTNHITDWHPAYYVIVMLLLSKIFYSPAILSLFQILSFSIALYYAGFVISKDIRIPTLVVLVINFIISSIPINGILMITIWKDILYSIFVFFLSITFWQYSREEKWLSNNWVLFGFVLANVWLLRHNGMVVALGSLLFLFIFALSRRKFIKPLIKSSLFLFLYLILIKGPVYSIFGVKENITQPFSVVFLHPLAAHVTNHTEMTPSEEKILDLIHPLDDWTYNCYDATVFLYKGFNVEVLQRYSTFLLKTILRLSISNPSVTLNHLFCQSSFIWNPIHPSGVMFESVYLQSSADYPNWEKYATIVSPDTRFPSGLYFFRKITADWLDIDHYKITLRPALYLFSMLTSFLIFSIRNRTPIAFIALMPIFFQIASIAFTYQYQGIRYVYPIYISALFFVPYFFIQFLLTKLKRFES